MAESKNYNFVRSSLESPWQKYPAKGKIQSPLTVNRLNMSHQIDSIGYKSGSTGISQGNINYSNLNSKRENYSSKRPRQSLINMVSSPSKLQDRSICTPVVHENFIKMEDINKFLERISLLPLPNQSLMLNEKIKYQVS